MAATLKLQSYGCNSKTVICGLQLRNCYLNPGTLKLQSHASNFKLQSYGCNFKTAIFWLQL